MRWKRSRRSGPRFGRVLLLTLLLALTAGYALYRVRPLPLPWQDVGSERIATPALDIASSEAREALRRGVHVGIPELGGVPLVESCRADAALPGEIYLLRRIFRSSHYVDETRTLVMLRNDGEAIVEGDGYDGRPGHLRRRLDANEAEAFRTLLLEAGYPHMRPFGSPEIGLPRRGDADLLSLQSCVRGRYFAVVRNAGDADDILALQDLAIRIEAFALEGSSPVAR